MLEKNWILQDQRGWRVQLMVMGRMEWGVALGLDVETWDWREKRLPIACPVDYLKADKGRGDSRELEVK